jgi:Thiamine pyrophosphate enzyme, C-terminal TPP binding domain
MRPLLALWQRLLRGSQGNLHRVSELWDPGFLMRPGKIMADITETSVTRPGMLVTSDSSFLFHIAELEVAVRRKLPLVCVVAVDFQWGLEVGVYKRTFG